MTSALPAVFNLRVCCTSHSFPEARRVGLSAIHPSGAFFFEPKTVFSEERCRAS